MTRIFKNEDFEFGLSIALGSTYSAQADAGECLAVAGRIKNGDSDSWVKEWSDAAARVRDAATAAEASGHRVSACEAWLRGATYFSTATYQIAGSKHGEHFEQLWEEHRDCWDHAVALFDPPVERVKIPYEDTTLEGYFFKVDDSDTRRPLFIYNNGSDGPTSAVWVGGGMGAIARGYNVLTFDGPGQNAALVRQRLYFRPDWEAVITRVVDYALARADVDPERIVLHGVSQAGYWVPRALAFEHRIAAAVADPGVVDVGTTWREKLPKSMIRQLERGEQEKFDRNISMAEHFVKGMRAQLEFRMRPFGMDSAYDVYKALEEYKLDTLVEDIRSPMLICDPDNEQFWPGQSRQLYDALPGPKAIARFPAEEGSDWHCEPRSPGIRDQRVFDWLDETVGR
ncbi:MAG TPA: hypothetical protein VGH24_12130 [Solirubrobacteraceae bacterium]